MLQNFIIMYEDFLPRVPIGKVTITADVEITGRFDINGDDDDAQASGRDA
jgi:hypothetical protein